MPKFKLTTSSVKQRCRPPADGETKPNGKPIDEHWYWDTEDRGFFLKISRTCSTFFVQRDVRGRTRRVKIGRHPTWTVDQARKRARELIVQMDQGIDPNAQKREEAARGTTLREARDWHLASMQARRCAQRSLETVRYETDRQLSDWLDRPLADIRPNECARRHERITKESGPYAANRALQTFRACWNTAARRLDDLPRCPTRGVTFNKTRRRREPIPWAKLSAWRRAVDGIRNPIRRDLQLFILFTGLRSTDAKTVRWDDVDFEAGTIHRPKPKGGED
ncbi:MAG: tyrosine-type recombinase/integrase, partial [Planctomycetota bacterium]